MIYSKSELPCCSPDILTASIQSDSITLENMKTVISIQIYIHAHRHTQNMLPVILLWSQVIVPEKKNKQTKTPNRFVLLGVITLLKNRTGFSSKYHPSESPMPLLCLPLPLSSGTSGQFLLKFSPGVSWSGTGMIERWLSVLSTVLGSRKMVISTGQISPTKSNREVWPFSSVYESS